MVDGTATYNIYGEMVYQIVKSEKLDQMMKWRKWIGNKKFVR